jgi:hypothetical protein
MIHVQASMRVGLYGLISKIRVTVIRAHLIPSLKISIPIKLRLTENL